MAAVAHIVQHIRTNNDVNGNPRRLYVVYQLPKRAGLFAQIVGVFEEGYGGMPDALRKLTEISPVYVGGAEYQRYKRVGKSKGVYHHSS